ncbi:MAG: cation diffusion facilitator family transporter [Paramuribaculum sp.]|nr:cation diffusion facilitator family transporter [Paramuribaculum sp.]
MEIPERITERTKMIYRVTMVGSIGNFILVLFKFIAGVAGRSNAMIADAVHSLSDFATDIIVILFVRISSKPQDKNHDFGHGKYETLATAIIGLILFAVGLGVFWNSGLTIWQWWNGAELESPGILALVAAVVSIAVKEILYQYTVRVGRKIDSQAVIANAWHHRSDALSSIGAAIGIGGAILLGAKWRVLDPLAAVVVSIFIMRVAYKLIVPCFEELMEKSLSEDVERGIENALVDILADCDPHNMRTRRIGNQKAVDVHVRMNGNMTVTESHEITKLMEKRIKAILGADAFINIHVEPRK